MWLAVVPQTQRQHRTDISDNATMATLDGEQLGAHLWKSLGVGSEYRAQVCGLPSPEPTGNHLPGDCGTHIDLPSAIGDVGAMERIGHSCVRGDLAETARVIELQDYTRADAERHSNGSSGHQGTILEIGSSMMSVAPASESAGISTLIRFFSTTVSTA